MNIVDANVILRYLLNDIKDLAEKAAQLLESEEVYIPNEITAEVVYVLEKVYKVEREDIASAITELLGYSNINIPDRRMLVLNF